MYYCYEHIISAGRTSTCYRGQETCATERMFDHIRLRDKFEGLETTQCEATPIVSCFSITDDTGKNVGGTCYKSREHCEDGRPTLLKKKLPTDTYSPCFPLE